MYNNKAMVQCVHESAPAKVNLSLKVLPKRSDGFHDIESIFQLIPLCDELEAVCVANNSQCTVQAVGMDIPVYNTLTATYNAFRKVTGISDGVSVILKKNIPDGAGLGGGSSDSAAMVRLLCRMFNKKLTVGQISQIASLVGSDVFFFLLCNSNGNSGCALVAGRGEKVIPILPRRDLFFVLVCPEVHSSTQKAYALVDGYAGSGAQALFPDFSALESVYRKNPADWTFDNSFTQVLITEYPTIAKALSDIQETGASFVQMSGSGSSVFGVFLDSSMAQAAFNGLRGKWDKCYLFASA